MTWTKGAGTSLRCAVAALALGCGICVQAGAQPAERANAVLLVAKQSITDPNFRQTVVLVTQAPDSSTIGVILNRPTQTPVARYFPPDVSTARYRDPVYYGGPVMREVIVALFRTDAAPPPHSFRVLRDVYLTMQPATVASLLAERSARYRLYAGFSAWAPQQLERELERDSWVILGAGADLMFRRDTRGLWQELITRAAGERAAVPFFTPRPDGRTEIRVSRQRATRRALTHS